MKIFYRWVWLKAVVLSTIFPKTRRLPSPTLKCLKVFYATNVGVFRLTARGMELTRGMPGVDVQKDIIDFAPMKIVLPEDGEVPVVDESSVTGNGFRLELK